LAKLRAVRDESEPCWDKGVCDPATIVPDSAIDARLGTFALADP
jgi:hypothetical protein